MLSKYLKPPCEDSHTASVFTHLLHLPSETFWRLLRNACYTDRLPDSPGELRSVHPWPRWVAGSDGKHVVIPDLFVRFVDFDLLIEAKRGDKDQQSPEQWKRELAAYANEYGEEKQELKIVALGGLFTEQDTTISFDLPTQEDGAARVLTAPVHMCRWRGLLYQCQRMSSELAHLEYPTSQSAATQRILGDLIDLFAYHGYSTGKWFDDFDFARHRLSPSPVFANSLRLLRDRSAQLVTP